MAALLRVERTVPAQDNLLWSNHHTEDASRLRWLFAGAVRHVIDADDTAADVRPGEEVLACLASSQLAVLQRTPEISAPLYAICRKPDNLDAGESAEILIQFLSAVRILDQANMATVVRKGQSGHVAPHPNNVALLMRESKSAIVLVQLLHHTLPDLDVFFVYEERPPDFN